MEIESERTNPHDLSERGEIVKRPKNDAIGRNGSGPEGLIEVFTKLDREFQTGRIPLKRYLELKDKEIRRAAKNLAEQY